MIDPATYASMKKEIAERMLADAAILNQLRSEIRPLRNHVRRIQSRTTTAISLVATDGGNNRIEFDPFLVQLVRVVDSSNNEYCLEAVTPTTDIGDLSKRQFLPDGTPNTPLGQMMAHLGVTDLTQISHMIRRSDDGRPTSPTWIQVYRELVEWAVLFSIVRNYTFGTDTIIVVDGLLRSKVFAKDLFKRFLAALQEGIQQQWTTRRRHIYLAGVAKHNKVLDRYRLAMHLEGILKTDYPSYVLVPREIEENAYIWSEYARGDDREMGGEINKFVGGKMFFVKFGQSPRDPIWPIDIFLPQESEASTVLGYMLADAINGFPVPFYPLCLQEAHANAALVDFDFDVYQDYVFDGIRQLLGEDGDSLDVFRLQDADPSQGRYG
jgi:hypothetical protein